ncbi:beta/alpha barrel domain-containing protein [Lactobacillus isalae]|uniref:hypothetical protein n=1 Tax=Lactobacillus isalae TaxID=2993455 RepID=UPI0024A8CBD4|nr:hypothetical protein [Lactobacillus isalae]
MVNDDVYVVEIIEQYNIDDPSCVTNFNTYIKLFRDIDKARVYLKLVKQAWLEDEDIDPKDIYEHSDEIGIEPNEISKYGFNLQADIQAKELN